MPSLGLMATCVSLENMTSHEFKNLLEKYSKGECSQKEVDFILSWYNNISLDQNEEKVDFQQLEKGMWSKIKKDTIATGTATIRSSNSRKIAASISVLAIAFVGYFLVQGFLFKDEVPVRISFSEPALSGTMQVANTNDFEIEVPLSDGSRVTLHPNSEIRFNESPSGNREVSLSGEAFFDVKRDTLRPFLVYTNGMVTKVLGTSFTIKAYQDDKEVTVAVRTGRVSVSTFAGRGIFSGNNPSEIILVPNQQAVYHKQKEKILKQLVDKPEIVLAKPTLFEMQYDGAPVARIFKVLEENYGVEIRYDENVLSNCILTTSFSDEGLYERIEIICKAIGAEYSIEDAVIIINSDGCQ